MQTSAVPGRGSEPGPGHPAGVGSEGRGASPARAPRAQLPAQSPDKLSHAGGAGASEQLSLRRLSVFSLSSGFVGSYGNRGCV